jgi:hypothetical protein
MGALRWTVAARIVKHGMGWFLWRARHDADDELTL